MPLCVLHNFLCLKDLVSILVVFHPLLPYHCSSVCVVPLDGLIGILLLHSYSRVLMDNLSECHVILLGILNLLLIYIGIVIVFIPIHYHLFS